MLLCALLSFTPPLSPLATRRAAIAMKADAEVDEEKPQVHLEAVGSIVDFGDTPSRAARRFFFLLPS